MCRYCQIIPEKVLIALSRDQIFQPPCASGYRKPCITTINCASFATAPAS